MRTVLAALFLIAFGAEAGTISSLESSVFTSGPTRFDVWDSDHPLVLLMPDPVVVEAESARGAHVEFQVYPYGGRDLNPVVRCEPPSGSLFPRGPSTSQCVATNSYGDRASGTVSIFVFDGSAPLLDLPDDIVVETDGDSAVVEFEATAYDAIDGELPVTCAPASGSRFPLGTTTVDCTATDSSLNPAYGSFTVTVNREDGGEPPVLFIQVPAGIHVEAAGPAGTRVEFEVTTTGSTDPNPAVTCDPVSGSTFPVAITTVLCIATDSFGNRAEGTFEVHVNDTVPPVLTLNDVTVTATSSAGAVVTFFPTAQDGIDGNVTVDCTPPSGSQFPVGATTVQCTATDNSGNTGSGSFVVTVNENGGGPVLFLQVPSPIEAEATTSAGATVEFTVTTTGSTDPHPTVTCSPASGSTFAVGTTNVLCVATDTYGNSAEGTFPVLVRDSVAPMIVSLSATPNLLAPANHKLVDVAVTVEATDSIDPMPQCYAYEVTANEPVDAPGSGNTDFDWMLTGPLALQLRAERAGDGSDRIYRIFVRCSDSSGNDTTGSVEVRVPKSASGDDATIETPKRRRSVGRR